MGFVEIVEQIRRDCRAREAEAVVKIRAALSPDEFTAIFTYQKGRQIKVISKNDVILRHFRRLQDSGTAPSVSGLAALPIGGEDADKGDEANREEG